MLFRSEIESAGRQRSTQHWPLFFARLEEQGRAFLLMLDGVSAYVAAERLAEAKLLWPDVELPGVAATQVEARPFVLNGTEDRPAQTFSARDAATTLLVQGWLQVLGPTTAQYLGAIVHLHPRSLYQAFVAMEMQGIAMRGIFERPKPAEDTVAEIEWCERRILQRIHRLTLGTLRKQIEPVSPAVFMRWLLDWHHLTPEKQLSGEEGVLAAIEQMEGFEAPAVEWERTLLPARIAHYDPQWLDNLCLAGVIGWGRISPHPAWSEARADGEAQGPRRVIPTIAAPITFYLRESAEWLHQSLAENSIDENILGQSLSAEAQQIRKLLVERGAAFVADLQRLSGLTKLQTTTALWELAAAGLASADGYDQLRAMMDPRRKSVAIAQTPATSLRKRAAARTTAGRWSLLCETRETDQTLGGSQEEARLRARQQAIATAKQRDAALDAHARILLTRYGVLFRDLLARESNAPKWRDLVPVLRRLEARGEIRGGRFVSGPFGEQYALPEAVESLRAARREMAARASEEPIAVAAADPLNLAGVIVPGERVPAVPGRVVRFANGAVVEDETAAPVAAKRKPSRSIAELLRAEAVPSRSTQAAVSLGLFS